MRLVIHIVLLKKVKINLKSLMVKIFLLVLFRLDWCRKLVLIQTTKGSTFEAKCLVFQRIDNIFRE